jgi:hypothetical protein
MASGSRNGSVTHPERRRRGTRNTEAKLTDEQVLKIREMYASGANRNLLARQFEMSWPEINNIVKRRNWRHI